MRRLDNKKGAIILCIDLQGKQIVIRYGIEICLFITNWKHSDLK